MKTIFVFLLLICSPKVIAQCLQLDLVILADISGSVSGKEHFIVGAVYNFTNKFKGTDVHVSLVTFAESSNVQFHLGDSVAFIIMAGGNTDLTGGIHASIEELYGYGRAGYRKMIVLISDGAPDSAISAKRAVSEAKRMGIGVCGVLINSSSAIPSFMKEIADVYVETDYENLSEELLKLSMCI
jgi:Mg-chelatase subunit ChlD